MIFDTMRELRQANEALIEAYYDSDSEKPAAEVLQRIIDFSQRTINTGEYLDRMNDRWEAQNDLNFWNSILTKHRDRLDAAGNALTSRPLLLLPSSKERIAERFNRTDPTCPYPGGRPFTVEESKLFFGQAEPIQTALEILNTGSILLLHGPPGSGKTSLVNAGIFPKLQEKHKDIKFVSLTPEDKPELPDTADSFIFLDSADAPLLKENDGDKGWAVIFSAPKAAFRRFIVVAVDVPDAVQVEVSRQETHGGEEITSTEVAAVEKILEKHGIQNVKSYQLPAPRTVDLHEIILRPAESVGLQIEAGVVSHLIRETINEPPSLSLLATSLHRLWDFKEGNCLSLASYQKNADNPIRLLRRSAEEAFNILDTKQQEIARSLSLALLEQNGMAGRYCLLTKSRNALAKSQKITSNDAALTAVITAFAEKGIVRITPHPGKDAGLDRLTLAHPSLTRAWSLLDRFLLEQQIAQSRRALLETIFLQAGLVFSVVLIVVTTFILSSPSAGFLALPLFALGWLLALMLVLGSIWRATQALFELYKRRDAGKNAHTEPSNK